MRKPMIGIVPLIDYEKESYWMLPGYMKGIQEAGGIPICALYLNKRVSAVIWP